MITLHIPLECGEETCAAGPGKFCQYVCAERFGSRYYCQLFCSAHSSWSNDKTLHDELKEKDGWLMRHPECVKFSTNK